MRKVTLKILDTTKPMCYTSNIGGVAWQLYCVRDAGNTSRPSAQMPSGAHYAESLKIGKNLNGMREAIVVFAVIAEGLFSEGQSAAERAITKLVQVTSWLTRTLIGVVEKLARMVMSTFASEALAKDTMHTEQSTLLLWKNRLARNYRKVGSSITSMVSGMITELRTWLRCPESVITSNSPSSHTSNASESLRQNFTRNKVDSNTTLGRRGALEGVPLFYWPPPPKIR